MKKYKISCKIYDSCKTKVEIIDIK